MKKILQTIFAIFFGITLLVWVASAASSDCLKIKFDNGDSICLDISKSGTKNFKLSVAEDNLSKHTSLTCRILLPNSEVYSLNNCKWTFSYNWSSTKSVVLYASYRDKNDNSRFKRQEVKINFNNGSRWSSNTSSSSSSTRSSSRYNDDIEVSASPTNPDTYDWVKLTITTDDDYTGKINFSRFQYRSSSSSSWSSISRTSSTYVSDYSSEWSNGYYRMTSSDDGEVTLKNLIKFKKSWYYRIYVEDTDGNESYVQINVDTSSSSSSNSDEIELSTNRKSPSTSQYVNLTIDTDDSRYTGKLTLSVKYRKSSSSSWSSISRTSSTYFNDYSNDWSRGYYKMTSSDRGNVTLNSLVKFRKNGYYRIYVEDTDGNESYIQFNVGWIDDDDESDVDGFSSTEFDKVKKIYKEWNSMIAQMQREYPVLKRNNSWIRLSDNFYDDMKDVINNKKSRDFDDFDDFQEAFDERYNYSMKNI